MMTRQDIENAILESLCLERVDLTVQTLNEVYEMPCSLVGDRVHFLVEDFSIEADAIADFMTGIVRWSDDAELLENYSLLSGVEHVWVIDSEESDCQPQRVAKPKMP
jgi:hypothetical protein